MNNNNNIYQDFILKTYKDEEEQVNIKYLSHNAAAYAKHMEHLSEAVCLKLNPHGNRIIIIADSKAYGYQAANFLLAKSQNLKTDEQDSFSEFDSDENDFDEFFDELLKQDECNNKNMNASYLDLTKDMVVVKAEIWEPGTDELMPVMIPLQRSAAIFNMIDRAANMLLYCSRKDQDSTKIMEEINNHLEHMLNFFLLLPSDSVSENFVERLVFEHDFSVIRVKEPSNNQLQSVFKDLAVKHKLTIADSIDVKEIIQELKNYRKDLFWEKDIEKLIINTAKKVKGRVAQKADFSLYYYKGQGVSAEAKLSRLIGQQNVKDQILRTVASFKLAAMLNEKYGTETVLYKHMSFAGAPGTGKTRIARIVAELFHENGLSNGIFLEVGRNDLVAGYLGQTAIKVARLFEKAKGGTIFIDEAGALVENYHDSYTKEAITTLIRFMENNPDTTVILATYPDEMERLLDSDKGFRSRIAKIIEFTPYTNEELWEIIKLMAADQHYRIEDCAKDIVFKYIEALRKAKKDEFGNAREMRKLLQTAQEEAATRLFKAKTYNECELITCDDIKKAASILANAIPKAPQPIGFSMPAKRPCNGSI